ncbi:MAG: RtcB family protein [Vulcanococcus sp.]
MHQRAFGPSWLLNLKASRPFVLARLETFVDLSRWTCLEPCLWQLHPGSAPGALLMAHGSRSHLEAIDELAAQQAAAIAALDGLMTPVHLLPDAHGGFGLPHGSVFGFDPAAAQIVLSGAAEFDHAFGMRVLRSNLHEEQLLPELLALAEDLQLVVAGPPPTPRSLDGLLVGGAHWAVEQGWGFLEDLSFCEERGVYDGCDPACVDEPLRERWSDQLQLPALGNQQLELHVVDQCLDAELARAFGLQVHQVLAAIHAGSANLGPMLAHGLQGELGSKNLNAIPLESPLGQRALQQTQIALNCASALRQVLSHRLREVVARFWPSSVFSVLCDFAHNSYRHEAHLLGHDSVELWVQRCGAVRAYGPSHGDLRDALNPPGTAVLLGGALGGPTELICGVDTAEQLALSSTICGIGAVAEAEQAGLCRRVARLRPLLCLQG